MKRTNRSFTIYGEIKHDYGGLVRVLQSSSAMKHAAWIFINNEGSELEENDAAHLTVAQARKVIKALEKFIADNQ